MATGHDPRLLDPLTDRLFVAALRSATAKAMLRGPDGEHIEILIAGGIHNVPACTRCYMNLEDTAPELCSRLRPCAVVNHVVNRVNAYVSPPGCGTPLHFDVRSVCIVQLFGQKTWRIDQHAAVIDPTHNCVFQPGATHVRYGYQELAAPTQLRSHLLRPGDWLLVPRGVWHETVSDHGSVSASLAAPEGT